MYSVLNLNGLVKVSTLTKMGEYVKFSNEWYVQLPNCPGRGLSRLGTLYQSDLFSKLGSYLVNVKCMSIFIENEVKKPRHWSTKYQSIWSLRPGMTNFLSKKAETLQTFLNSHPVNSSRGLLLSSIHLFSLHLLF